MTFSLEEQRQPQQQQKNQQQAHQQQSQRAIQPLQSRAAQSPDLARPEKSRQATPPPQPRSTRGTGSARRSGGPSPRSLSQVLKEADRMVVEGELDEYLPVPTGFDQIDRLIGEDYAKPNWFCWVALRALAKP